MESPTFVSEDGAVDAAPEPPPTSIPDSDVPETDGASEDAQDAGDANDAALSDASPCAVSDAHTLCEDFDKGIDPSWTKAVNGLVSLGTTTAYATSPPNALSSTKTGDTSRGEARLIMDVPGLVSRTQCDYDVLLTVAPNSGGEVLIFGLSFEGGSSYAEATILASKVRSLVFTKNAFTQLGVSIPVGTWTHVRFVVTGRASSKMTVWINGNTALQDFALTLPTDYAFRRFYVGGFDSTFVGGPWANWSVYLDNVVCDSMP